MVNRARVLWLIKGLGLGGAEKLLELAIQHIDRDRFDYEVAYLLPWKNALAPKFQEAGIPVHCLNQTRAYDLRVVPQLAGLLRRREVDLLHSHLPYTGIMGRIASRLAPVKAVVYTEHNLWERYHWLTGAANRLTYRWNDAVIAVSGEVEHSIRSHYKGSDHLEMDTILNGVDVEELSAVARDVDGVREEFGIPSHHQIVVHVASFTPKKRHEDLLKAAQMVVTQNPSVTFLLVGQGILLEAEEARARSLGLENNVVFAGFRSDAPRLVRAADMFVLSSQYEGLPISMLEAMALRRPVVVTSVGGIPEVITDNVEGFLVEPLRPERLAEKISRVLQDPDLQQRFAENAYQRVLEGFGVARMIESTEALYTRVLAEKGKY